MYITKKILKAIQKQLAFNKRLHFINTFFVRSCVGASYITDRRQLRAMLNYLQKWKEQNISLSYEFHLSNIIIYIQ